MDKDLIKLLIVEYQRETINIRLIERDCKSLIKTPWQI